jgi:hypothetical protein
VAELLPNFDSCTNAARRRQRAVAKLRLDDVYRFALGCELGREGVAKTMRVDSLLDARLRR